MKIVVAAVPGSGKSTIMKMIKGKKKDVKIVNVGDIISDIAMKKLKIKDRDKLRKTLTLKQEQKFQEEAGKKIRSMRAKNLIIDTHTAIKTPKGYFPGLSEKTADLIKPNVIVFLDYEPSDIIKMRKGDPTRHRDDDNEHDIEQHQSASLQFAFEAASHVEASVDIIDLREPEKKKFDHAKKAATEIIKLMKKKAK